jgi:UDP-N-acetylmuramyl-tripeptide synthetase
MAVQQGARVVVAERDVDFDVVTLQVEDARTALAKLAARFYGEPSQRMKVIGVTGTSGKTTVTYLLENILEQAGYRTGVIGTVNCRWGGKTRPSPVTTPESLDLQEILAAMATDGVTHAVMEISSHALALKRVAACYLDVGIFTNLSQDHLDYHGTMEAYWSVKRELFSRHLFLGPKGSRAVAVVNTQNRYGRELKQNLRGKCLTSGSEPTCDIQVHCDQLGLTGLQGRIITPRGTVPFQSALVGAFNQENIASAVGAVESLGVPLKAVRRGIAQLGCVPGRLELVPHNGGPRAYVDYAHKPSALEHVLATLRSFSPGRLITVFGCGGDRDREKRPLMGGIAARGADLTIVTSDNPRTEDPMDIIDEILPGVRGDQTIQYDLRRINSDWSATGYGVEPDRRRAIRTAVRAARDDDVIVVAGKGHETYQIIGTARIDFDDRQEVAQALATRSSN